MGETNKLMDAYLEAWADYLSACSSTPILNYLAKLDKPKKRTRVKKEIVSDNKDERVVKFTILD